MGNSSLTMCAKYLAATVLSVSLLGGCAQTKSFLSGMSSSETPPGDPGILGAPEIDYYLSELQLLASGDPGDFLTQSVCVATELPHDTHAVSFADSGLPPAVTLEYYLVRAQHACGEGSVGTTHEGLERPAASCP